MTPALLLATLVQTIWIVDAANGPGTNFTSIPPAIAAASNGDTILVRPGSYSAFIASGKSLTVRGSGATVQGYPSTTIAGVPAGTRFYLSGLTFLAISSAGFDLNNAGLHIVGSEVVLTDVTTSGVTCCGQYGTPGLSVQSGAVVHAARCSFTGTLGYAGNGGHGAVLVGALLAADACTFTGGGGHSTFFPGWTVSGAGVLVNGGAAVLSRCSATGGNASLGGGGPGVALLNAFARIAGNSSNLIKGGNAAGGAAGDAIYADPNSSAVVHGNPMLVPGSPGGLPASGAVTLGAVPLPYLSVSGTAAAGGELQGAQPVTLTLEGQIPNAPFALLVDLVPTFSSAYAPLTIGELLVPVPLVFPLEGTLNGAGMFQLSFTPAVSVPALLDVPLYAQAAVVDAVAGNVRLSNGWIRVFKP